MYYPRIREEDEWCCDCRSTPLVILLIVACDDEHAAVICLDCLNKAVEALTHAVAVAPKALAAIEAAHLPTDLKERAIEKIDFSKFSPG